LFDSKNNTNYFLPLTKGNVEKFIFVILKAIRLALIVSTFVVLSSLTLRLIYGAITPDNYYSVYSTILWYSSLFTMWTVFLSLPTLLIVLIYKRITSKTNWTVLKKELRLFAILTIAIIVFVCVNRH
jgi:hypothetical protein